MNTKSISLSFEGLQNVVLDAVQGGNEFRLIFGKREIIMNSLFADFISPLISRLHRSDPTISSISFNDQNANLISDDVISLFKQISTGKAIEINEKQGLELRIISILLENQELFTKINDIYTNEINEGNIDLYIQDLQLYNEQQDCLNPVKMLNAFNYKSVINYLASHFYSIDQDKLLRLPKSIIYKIITNKNLKLKDEDSLIDFIQKIFSDSQYGDEEEDNSKEEEDEEKIGIISFYESVDFSSLSESKFQEFTQNFESKTMTKTLWRKLNQCFYTNFTKTNKKINKNRYIPKDRSIEFDGNEEHGFQGIIHKLTEEIGGNVNDKGMVNVTSSPSNGNDYDSKNIVDFDDNHYFQSKNELNSWVKFDFQELKVRPTHYSIRTRPDGGKGDNHPKNWVIEGSNSDDERDWKVLDSRENVTILDDGNKSYTFDIQNPLNPEESYRYLRLRQTGPNTQKGNFYFLTLSALEYFGILYSE